MVLQITTLWSLFGLSHRLSVLNTDGKERKQWQPAMGQALYGIVYECHIRPMCQSSFWHELSGFLLRWSSVPDWGHTQLERESIIVKPGPHFLPNFALSSNSTMSGLHALWRRDRSALFMSTALSLGHGNTPEDICGMPISLPHPCPHYSLWSPQRPRENYLRPCDLSSPRIPTPGTDRPPDPLHQTWRWIFSKTKAADALVCAERALAMYAQGPMFLWHFKNISVLFFFLLRAPRLCKPQLGSAPAKFNIIIRSLYHWMPFF